MFENGDRQVEGTVVDSDEMIKVQDTNDTVVMILI
jgi:hypothetical protein